MAEEIANPMTTKKDEVDGGKMSKSSDGSGGSPRSKFLQNRSFSYLDAKDNARMLSGENPVPAKTRVPIHLRVSTGSCHDSCKHGTRHSSEEEPRKPLHKRVAKPLPMTTVVTVVKSDDFRKRLLVLKPSSDAKSSSTKHTVASDTETASLRQRASSGGQGNSPAKKPALVPSQVIIKREVLVPSEKVELPREEEKCVDKKRPVKVSVDKTRSRRSIDLLAPVKLRLVKVRLLAAFDRKGRNIMTPRKTAASTVSLRKTAPTNAGKPRKQISSSSLKGQSKAQRVEPGTSSGEVPEKIVHVIQTDSNAKASHEEDGDVKRSVNEADKIVSENMVSLSDDHPVKQSSSLPLPPPEFPPPLSRKENDKGVACEDQKTEESEKIIVVEMDKTQTVKKKPNRGIPPLQSRPSSSVNSSHKDVKINCGRNSKDENAAPKKIVETPFVEENCSKIPMKRRVVPSDDRGAPSSPQKLKFRPGTVLNPQPLENNVPRRLKFRRTQLGAPNPDDFASNKKKSTDTVNARLNNQPTNEKNDKPSRKSGVTASNEKHHANEKNSKVSRKSGITSISYEQCHSTMKSSKPVDLQSDNNSVRRLRLKTGRPLSNDKGDPRRRTLKKNLTKDDAAVNPDISSLKTRLKHQSMQRKKVTRVLFNNVIEETANKLVKTRKSKVKALVGAFETVIHLQDGSASSGRQVT